MNVAILGAGVSGLSAAQALKQQGITDVQVFEATDRIGGMARSFEWHGFTCDLAPHRFFTENPSTLAEITSMVPMRRVRRQSAIHVGGRWIQDPVNAAEVVVKFFPGRSFSIIWHYLFRRQQPEDSFEKMVLNKFGRGLHEFFFRPYSEKLFGIPADQISTVWGRKKIRVGGLRDMIMRKTRLYFREFYYPTQGGYGAICDALYADVKEAVRFGTQVTHLRRDADGRYTCRLEHQGQTREATFDTVISSLPVTQVAAWLDTPLTLRFRPAKIAYLLIARGRVTDNHWFYFADDHISINRVAEFRHFAGAALPQDRTVICCEVTQTERFSIERVVRELVEAGVLKSPDEVLDTRVEDMPFAYPVYHLDYDDQMQRIRDMDARHPNLYHVGRNAQFVHRDVDELYEDARRAVACIVAGTGNAAARA